MRWLRKAEKARRGSGGAIGLLAQAMIYRRSMETAGLLSRAAHLKKKTAEAGGKAKGLLQKAVEAGTFAETFETEGAYAGEEGPEGQGLLARAMKFRAEYARDVALGATGLELPTISDSGLLAKALRYRMPIHDMKGLLEKAEAYAFPSEAVISERVRREPVSEKQAPEEEEKAEEVAYEPAEMETDLLEEARLEAEKKAPEKAPAPEFEAEAAFEKPEKFEEEAPVPETYSAMLLRDVEKRDTLSLIQLLSRIIAEEGYETLLQQVLEVSVRIGKGKKGALFTAQKSSFVPEYVYGIEWSKKGRQPSPARQLGIRFRKKSALVEYLIGQGTSIVRGADITDEMVKPDLAAFGEFEPCTLLPLVTGTFLSGIILIGNHSKRPKQDTVGMLFLARIFSIHLYTHVLERSLQKTIEEYAGKNRELTSLLSLYDYSGIKSIDLDEVLKNMAEAFGIESAVLTGGWDSRGSVRVYAGFGISEKGLRRYKISKTDREIKAVVKSGVPGVLPNAEMRLEKLPEEDRKNANAFAAVPVIFNGETLAILFVHRMKGVAARISGVSAVILKNMANTLVPFILYVRMTELEPFEVLEKLLKREAQRAKKKKAFLNIVAFKIKNYRAVIQKSGFRQYRNLLHRFHSLVKKSVGRGDIVQIVSLNKVVLLLIRKDQEQVGEAMKKVKVATSVLVDKKKTGVALSYSPLRTSYPNESKSIPEILQLIE